MRYHYLWQLGASLPMCTWHSTRSFSPMEENKKICRLSLTYTIVADGLIGGKYEYDPYLENHATFGAYRVKEKDPLILIDEGQSFSSLGARNLRAKEAAEEKEDKTIYLSDEVRSYKSSKPWELTLMDYDQMKGDDTLHFKLFSHTRYSGVDSIDENEAAYRERQIQSGSCSLELFDLFRYYHEARDDEKEGKVTFAVTDTFYDQKIIDEKARDLLKLTKSKNPTTEQVNEMMGRAKSLTEKATIVFTITVIDFSEPLFKKSIFAVAHLKERQLYSKLPLAGGAAPTSSGSCRRKEGAARPCRDRAWSAGSTRHWHSSTSCWRPTPVMRAPTRRSWSGSRR